MLKVISGFLIFFSLLSFTSCMDEESITGPLEPAEIKDFPKLSLPFSSAQKQHYSPSKVMEVVRDLNTLDKYNFYHSLAFWTKNKNLSEITFEKDGLFTRLEFIQNDKNGYNFNIYLTGEIGENSLNNFLIFAGRYIKHNINNPGYDHFAFKINSFTTSEKKEVLYFVDHTETENIIYTTNDGEYTFLINKDKSGSFTHYPLDYSEYVSFRTIWNVDGSGEWWQYDEGYVVSDTGVWN